MHEFSLVLAPHAYLRSASHSAPVLWIIARAWLTVPKRPRHGATAHARPAPRSRYSLTDHDCRCLI
eukprot:2277958-Pleurochrysis_carterae.AAC.1